MQTWHVILVAHVVASIIANLVARRYAQNTKLNPLVAGIATNAVIGLPYALIYLLVFDVWVTPSLATLVLAIFEAVIGTTSGYVSQLARKHSDASSNITFGRLSAIPITLGSALALGETLSGYQTIGAGLLLGAALIIGGGFSRRGLRYNLLGVFLIAGVVLMSRQVIIDTSVGTYLVLASVLGLVNKLVLKGGELPASWSLIKRDFPMRAVMSLMTLTHIVLFSLATDLAGHVALVSSLANIKIVTITLAAALWLGERNRLRLKIVAATVALLGVLISTQ